MTGADQAIRKAFQLIHDGVTPIRGSPLRAPTDSAGGQSSEMPAVTIVAAGFVCI